MAQYKREIRTSIFIHEDVSRHSGLSKKGGRGVQSASSCMHAPAEMLFFTAHRGYRYAMTNLQNLEWTLSSFRQPLPGSGWDIRFLGFSSPIPERKGSSISDRRVALKFLRGLRTGVARCHTRVISRAGQSSRLADTVKRRSLARWKNGARGRR